MGRDVRTYLFLEITVSALSDLIARNPERGRTTNPSDVSIPIASHTWTPSRSRMTHGTYQLAQIRTECSISAQRDQSP